MDGQTPAIRRLCKLLPMSVAADVGVKPVIEGDYLSMPQPEEPIQGVDMGTGEVLPTAQEQAQPQTEHKPRRAAAADNLGGIE